MVLLLDLGNTNLFVGVENEGKLIKEFRKHTDLSWSGDEYYDLLRRFFDNNNLDPKDFEGAILSSVIPSLSYTLKFASEKLLGKECLVVGKGVKSGLPIRIDNPSELGSDLVCDCVGALTKYEAPLIVVDLGTANKILVVDKNVNFVGCTISVGVKLGMKTLTKNTAQLVDVSLIAPNKVIGKNSVDSLNSGAIYGTIAMIEGMAERIEKELGYKCNKVLTGGNSFLIKDLIDQEFHFEPNIILEGLNAIYSKNK